MAIILASILFFTGVFLAYSEITYQRIFDETSASLDELYNTIKRTFSMSMEENWKMLRDWQPYFKNSRNGGEEQFREFVNAAKDNRDFTEFFYIDDKGNFQTIDGVQGFFSFDGPLMQHTQQENESLYEAASKEYGTLFLYAISVERGSVDDFEYTQVAVGYSKKTMEKTLNVQAYDAQADTYVTNSEGQIIMSDSEKKAVNILAYMRNYSELSDKQYSTLEEDFKSGQERVIETIAEKEKIYLVYMPIGVGNWMLVGSVPRKVVNANISKIQAYTMLMVGIAFLVLTVLAVGMVLARNKRNITEKIVELHFRERLFDILSNNTDDVFMMCNPETYEVEYISPNIERVLGLSIVEISKNIRSLGRAVHSDTDQAEWELMDGLALGESVVVETEREHITTGEHRWFLETIYHTHVEKQEKYILVLSDRTEDKKNRQALQDALTIAQVANEAKSTFLSNMSHDIRTPMNAIVGLSTLLERDADNPERVHDYTKKITSSSQHLLGLINDVLDMSKIESGKTTLNLVDFNLAELVDEISAILRPQAKAKQQNFDVVVMDISNENLFGDKLRLNQILINLLSNAVKYTQEGGQITFTIHELPQQSPNIAKLEFLVEDNGIGMSAEYLQKIFQPFTREQSDHMTEIQGTGLGMAITKNLVDLMGGTITVESEKGKGSIFKLDLDLRINHVDVDDQFWAKSNVTHALVVDDDVGVCTNIISAMSGTGVFMQFAISGKQAIQMTEHAVKTDCGFDLVLLDWSMPDMDGIQTARRIREMIPESVPIMILTAYDWTEIEGEAREAGIDGFLSKPFFLSSFRNTVEQIKQNKSGKAKTDPDKTESVLKGRHILAAEDFELNAEILTELLRMVGAECEIAVNGQKVLEKFENSRTDEYDLILMDVQMPVMNGYEATRAIRKCSHPRAASIPIVAMTANAFSEDVNAALESGMNAHLSKPINMKQLQTVVLELLK